MKIKTLLAIISIIGITIGTIVLCFIIKSVGVL